MIAVNQTLKLFVLLSTMTLENSSLSVDFGDNCGIMSAVHPEMASATEDSVDDVMCRSGITVSHDRYGTTCELHVELSHLYMTEGQYDVTVTAAAGISDQVSVSQNWTVVSVESPIENVFLVIDAVVAVSQNLTVTALISPVSQSVRYHWSISEFDFTRRAVNCAVILSASTDIPELQLVLTEPGDYLINVTAENEVSAAHKDVLITAVVPILSLSLSCDSDKYLSTNAIFDCVATVQSGTDVGFFWDFGDGISVHVMTGNSSSTATVTYSTVGQHNITVTAWNHLSSVSAWYSADIVENVFQLSAFAVEPVLVGTPVSVMACCMLGSNVSIVFDFGSGNHHLVLDPQSRTVTASHIYRITGTYAVTVKAENNISQAVTDVIVNVIEDVPDVDFKHVSALVAGRHSVFMTTFNGNCFLYVFEQLFYWHNAGYVRLILILQSLNFRCGSLIIL